MAVTSSTLIYEYLINCLGLNNREFKQTTTTTVTRTSEKKRFNWENNSCARAL